MRIISMNKIEASFRDPSGYVYCENGEIYRTVNFSYKEQYDYFISCGLYKKLVDKKYLIQHEEISENLPSSVYKILKPVKIPFVSYPYEWSFSQLKDAALLTLKIQFIALKYGMILKDASAYNVQFLNGKPVFIDTLSFEIYKEGQIWEAYRQFCQHFLAPLLLMSYKDLRFNQLLKTNIDGIPLDFVNSILPIWTKLNPEIFFNVSMQARLQKKCEHNDTNYKKKPHISKSQLLLINRKLQDLVSSLKFPLKDSEWGDYYTFTNYDDEAFECKKSIINLYFDKIMPNSLWDLGANNGLFTRLASSRGINSVAFDIDPIACEKNYNMIKKNNEENLLPLLFDLTNPSPSIGWANKERLDISGRQIPDVIMGLAIIHHIAISNNVPLVKIAEYFSSMSKYLIIEFVPKEDSQVQKLLATREDIFPNYTVEGFEEAFSQCYSILEKQNVVNSERILYLLKAI